MRTERRETRALDDRPPTRALLLVTDRWEWHEFEADGWAHLYRVTELMNRRLELLLPWCLVRAPFPLEHDLGSIGPRIVVPQRGRTCPACVANVRVHLALRPSTEPGRGAPA